MKKGIHPKFYTDTIVTCSCGATFVTGSTKQSIQVEICSKCHPLYTGEKRFVDTLGRVGKFQQKQQFAQSYQQKNPIKKKKKQQKQVEDPKSLKDLLIGI